MKLAVNASPPYSASRTMTATMRPCGTITKSKNSIKKPIPRVVALILTALPIAFLISNPVAITSPVKES